MSADGNYVVACGTGDGVYYWADAKGKSGSNVPWTWTYFFSPTTEVFGVDLSSNGDFVVAGTAGYIGPSGPSKVAYWKNARFLTGTGQPPNWASTEAGDSVLDVAVSDDGDYVAAAAEVNTVYYWAGAKLLTGDPSSRWYSGLSAYFLCVDMSSDGGSVIAGSTDKVYFWSDARGLTGKPQGWSWTYTTLGAVHDVAINHAGDYMAAANDVATPYVYFFDYRGNLLWSYGPLLDEVQALSISSDGGTLAAGAGLFFTTAYLFSTGYSTPQPVGGTIVPGSVVVATPYVIMLVAVASVVAIIAAGVKKRGH
jgi:WD40 repeat protein